MFRVLLSRKSSRIRRILAFTNISGFCYFVMMAFVTTILAACELVPGVFRAQSIIMWNYVAILYLAINVLGNFCNVCCTNSSVLRLNYEHSPNDPDKLIPGTLNLGNTNKGIKLFWCKKCKLQVPERSHHCTLCDICILKRDHHCFFMIQCIGYHNQKYFTVFCFYMFLSGMYGTVMLAKYLNVIYKVRFNGVHVLLTLLPNILWCWWTNEPFTKYSEEPLVTFYQMFLVGIFYACLTACLMAGGFFYWQITLVCNGQTTFEARKGIDTFQRNIWDNYIDVFGSHWFLLWFLPIRFDMSDNGTYQRSQQTHSCTMNNKYSHKLENKHA